MTTDDFVFCFQRGECLRLTGYVPSIDKDGKVRQWACDTERLGTLVYEDESRPATKEEIEAFKNEWNECIHDEIAVLQHRLFKPIADSTHEQTDS